LSSWFAHFQSILTLKIRFVVEIPDFLSRQRLCFDMMFLQLISKGDGNVEFTNISALVRGAVSASSFRLAGFCALRGVHHSFLSPFPIEMTWVLM
jgi:hypothetical protein